MKFAATHSESEVLSAFGTRMEGHLGEEVSTSRIAYGWNKVTDNNRHQVLRRIRRSFVNIFTVALFSLAILSELLEDRPFGNFFGDLQAHASFIVMISLIIISGLMTFITETRTSSAASKIASMVDVAMTVRRDGTEMDIDSDELVVGDIIILDTGDLVPADARLLTCNHLKVDESTLSGESDAVSKNADTASDPSVMFGSSNMVFMGSNVVSGSGEAVVFNVGDSTIFGSMAAELSKKKPETTYGRGSKKIVGVLLKIMIALVPIAFVIMLLKGDPVIDCIKISIALAIGLMPEMLPTIISANLAKGAVQMSKKKVIVKDMTSVQSLGAMSILCTDKTGTLTQNIISVESYCDIVGNNSRKVAKYVYLNAKNLTAATNQIDWAIIEGTEGEDDVEWADDYVFVGDVPFDSERKRTSVVLRYGDVDTMYMKGDMASVISVCDRVESPDGGVSAMTDEVKNSLAGLAEWYSTKGMRALGVAYGHMMEGQDVNVNAECEMIFCGFVIFIDPLKRSARDAVIGFRDYGVKVKVLTGDNRFVTANICEKLGIRTSDMLEGSEIDAMDDEKLRNAVMRSDVFVSLTPENKKRIVAACRADGNTVGMLGDGLNDVTAMRNADVGISVDTGADIAKETANMILLEKDLNIIKDGLIEGRRVYANTIKYVKMTSTANFGYMFSLIIATILFPFEPMTALQILVFNLIIDISCLAIPWDNVDEYYLKEPRTWDHVSLRRVFTHFGLFSTMTDVMTFAVLSAFILPCVMGISDMENLTYIAVFQTCWFVENFFMQVQIIHIIRTPGIPFIQSCASRIVILASVLVLVVSSVIPFTPLGDFLGMHSVPWQFFAFIPLIDGLYFVCMMLMKKHYIAKYGELL